MARSALRPGALKRIAPSGDLHQQGIVIRRNLRTGVGIAAVQPNAEAAGGAVRGDLSGVGSKVVGGVLGGDTALDGIAVLPDGLLVGNADIRGTEGIALRHQNLSLHQVHTCDHLSDSMLHLNTGIHFNEIVTAVPVHQELQSAGIGIAYMTGDLHRIVVQSCRTSGATEKAGVNSTTFW